MKKLLSLVVLFVFCSSFAFAVDKPVNKKANKVFKNNSGQKIKKDKKK